MKKFLACAMLGMFTTAMLVGCHASGEVGDADSSGDTSYKKTTTVHDNGDTKTTKTEVKKEY